MSDQSSFANEYIAKQTKMIQELMAKVILLDTQLTITTRQLQEYVVLEEAGEVDTSQYDNASVEEEEATPTADKEKNK